MKKIMFNDKYGLTDAVLDGRKTMTRRISTYEEIKNFNAGWLTEPDETGIFVICEGCRIVAKSQYKVGEVVAVAQSYKTLGLAPAMFDELAGWNNKMFVKSYWIERYGHPIRITNIKAERLQDINDEDCIKEGIYVNPNPPKWREYDPYEPWHPNVKPYNFTTTKGFCKPQFAFAFLIDAIFGKGTWKRNPFVFAYSFELIK